MATATQFRHEDIAAVPRGWRMRTVTPPGSAHQVRVAFPPGPRKKGSGKVISILHPLRENPKRCNPEELHLSLCVDPAFGAQNGRKPKANPSAAQLYKDFHGRSAHEVTELQEKLLTAGDYTALGDNPEIWLSPVSANPARWPQPDIAFEAGDGVKLATDSKRSQLYFIGGKQKLPLSYLKQEQFDTSKRFISLGEVYGISYETEKSFDDFKTSTYAHVFGEESGERPLLVYDQEAKRLLLVGGAYSIAPLDKKLGASPGIVN